MLSLRGEFISVTVGGAVTRDRSRILQIAENALREAGHTVMLRTKDGWTARPAKACKGRGPDVPVVLKERSGETAAKRMAAKQALKKGGAR